MLLGFWVVAGSLHAATPQTITFPVVPDCITTDGPFSLTATASSGLPVIYSVVSTGGVATVSGDVVTLTGVMGAVTLRASQPGDGTYAAAEAYRTFIALNPATQYVKLAYAVMGSHHAGVRGDGTLWTWGGNANGQLGDGTTTTRSSPVKIGSGSDWADVACGTDHTVALRSDGTLWSSGGNTQGQLGDGTTTARNTFAQVGTATTWTAAACGGSRTLALRADGTLWGWGANQAGYLGDGTSVDRNEPVQIGTATNWTAVACGSSHTMALRADGTLWVWGSNTFGQYGDGTPTGTWRYSPVQMGTGTEWASIACGEFHCLATRTDGTLWAWGHNSSGQLGIGGTDEKVLTHQQVGSATDWTVVACGPSHTLATRADGSLWGWGDNSSGQLGDGTAQRKFLTPVTITPPGGPAWRSLAAGSQHSAALSAAGALWLWGNVYDAFGGTLSSRVPALHPVGKDTWAKVAGHQHVAAIRRDGTLWAWGRNDKYQLGIGASYPSASPVQISTATNWTDVACGTEHSVALRADGSLWTWGSSPYGQLGNGSNGGVGSAHRTPQRIGWGHTWTAIACGATHTLALQADGTLWAWGNNQWGQLGMTSSTHVLLPTQVGTASDWTALACGESHSLALRANGTLWAWGNNEWGKLGDGSYMWRNTPVQIGSQTGWSAISAGGSFSMALRGGALWVWGCNNDMQFGNGSLTPSPTPVQVGSDTDWAAAACGDSHVLAIRTDGSLWTWGNNYTKGLGYSATIISPTRIGNETRWARCSGGYVHSMALREDGTLCAWRAGSEPQLGIPLNLWQPNRAEPSRAAQLIIFPALSAAGIGQPVILPATASSGLPVTYTVVGPAVISGQMLTATGPGTIRIAAYQSGNATWQAAAPVTQVLAPQAQVTGGDSPVDGSPALDNFTDFGVVNVPGGGRAHAFTIANTGTVSLDLADLAVTGPQAGDFSLATPAVSLVLPGESLTFQVTFSPQAAGLRQAMVTLPQTSGLTAPLTFAIQGTGLAGPAQALHFLPPPAGRLTTDAPFTLRASSSSGLPVTYTIVSPGSVADVSPEGVVTLTGTPGAFTVRASQAGNGSFNPAPDVFHSFRVMDAEQRFVQISAGPESDYSAAVRADGTLWTWGANSFGQLGDGTTTPRSTPAQVGAGTQWTTAACGTTFMLALRTDGTLWSWGDNLQGQLGVGTVFDHLTPAQVGTDTDWAAIACGASHGVALKTDGTLWGWGTPGRVGDGANIKRTSPVPIGTGFTWTAIAACGHHSLALRSDGTLWAWGNNTSGQLGDGTTTFRPAPVQTASGGRWKAIAAGPTHSLAVALDGQVWGWGSGSLGQLGPITSQFTSIPARLEGASAAAAVATGRDHSLVRRADGALLMVDNRAAPFRLGALSFWTAIACGSSHSLALDTSGVLHTWGDNDVGQLARDHASRADASRLGTDTSWTSASASERHTVGLRADGTLWSWGSNQFLRLGAPESITSRRQPGLVIDNPASTQTWASAAAGFNHNLAIRADGTLWAWGRNYLYQLGISSPTFIGQVAMPSPSGNSADRWLQVAAGDSYSMAIRTDGTLWAWGSGMYGQFGAFTPTHSGNAVAVPIQIGGSGSTWTTLACGNRHVLLLKADGTLWSAGSNVSGQLGRATPESPDIQQVGTASNWTAIAAGWYHSAAVRADGTLWTWGAMDGSAVSAPVPGPARVGTDANWKTVACGQKHTAALRSDGTLWAWGDNTSGQLGDGTTTYRPEPVQISTATNWTAVSCGTYHTVALRNDGTLWSWGDNVGGVLGNVDTTQPFPIWPARVPQALTFPALAPLLVGQPVTLATATTSGLPVTYTLTGPATLSGSLLTPTGPGSITVTAYQTGDDVWDIADSVMQTFQAFSPITQQSWRQTHFGTTSNTGTAADTYDADGDGLVNLVEYAFGLSPVAGGSVQLPQGVKSGSTFTVAFAEPLGVTGVVYGASYSPSLLPGSWVSIPDTGTGGQHVFSAPVGPGETKVFIRLEVTAGP